MQSAFLRSCNYQFQKLILRRKHLTATGLPLGLNVRFRTPDVVGRHLYKYLAWEPHILQYLLTEVRYEAGSLICDVGANLGWYSVLLDRLSESKSRILAFEPDPQNFRMLSRNLRLNDASSVRAIQLGLSDGTGSGTLHRYPTSNLGKHSLTRQRKSVGAIPVRLSTLDAVCEEYGLSETPVSLIKIDVEGHDIEVLHGAMRALSRTQLLIVEWTPEHYRPAAKAKALDALASLSFEPHVFNGEQWVRTPYEHIAQLNTQTDLIWTRPRFSP